MRRVAVVLVLVLMVLLLASCVPGSNPARNEPAPGEGVAGFWRGLWQGVIAPFTFVISLFTDDVNVYEVHNNGNWHNSGFVPAFCWPPPVAATSTNTTTDPGPEPHAISPPPSTRRHQRDQAAASPCTPSRSSRTLRIRRGALDERNRRPAPPPIAHPRGN